MAVKVAQEFKGLSEIASQKSKEEDEDEQFKSNYWKKFQQYKLFLKMQTDSKGIYSEMLEHALRVE